MYKLLLIWRYFRHKRIALVAVAAVALLVMMVVVVLSVLSGLLEETRARNHRWAGDVVISRDSLVGFPYYQEFINELQSRKLAAEATPVIRTFGLEGEKLESSVQIYGLRLAEFCRVTDFQETLYYQKAQPAPDFNVPPNPRLEELGRGLSPEESRRGCIISIYQLVRRRSVLKELRQEWRPEQHRFYYLTVFALDASGTLAGTGTGEHQRFFYVDDSDSGLVDLDVNSFYLDFDELQKLLWMDGSDKGPKRTNEIRVRLPQGVELETGRQAIASAWREFAAARAGAAARLLRDVKVETWQSFRRGQIAPAEKEKSLMAVIFLMIGFVAAFIIFAIFYMIVVEKIRDLGILKSVGAPRWGVGQIFIGFGIFVGVIGTILGTSAGVLIVTHSNEIEGRLGAWFDFKLWDPDVYAISRIPDTVDWSQVAAIAAVAIGVSVLGAIFPARRAARLQVVEALRVE